MATSAPRLAQRDVYNGSVVTLHEALCVRSFAVLRWLGMTDAEGGWPNEWV